jgi:hypothetical protein
MYARHIGPGNRGIQAAAAGDHQPVVIQPAPILQLHAMVLRLDADDLHAFEVVQVHLLEPVIITPQVQT